MENVKQGLRVIFSDSQKSLERLNLTNERLEEQLHRLQVEKDTLEFGKDSVDLTRRNIKFSLWVPISVFLIGTVLFESFKPEITSFIRSVVHRSPFSDRPEVNIVVEQVPIVENKDMRILK
jgi:hypothetical protein